MSFRTSFLFLTFALLSCACSEPPRDYQERIYVFGTLVDVTVAGVPEEKARAAVAAVAQDFQRMHYEWHAWEPGPLTEINAHIAAGEPATVIPSLLPVILQSRELSARSDNLFNPAIGRLLNLWGFQSSEMPSGPLPPREAINALVQAEPRMEQVSLEGNVLRSSNPAVQMDFGAFAKGYAVDLAIARLREFGVANAIVNAGGDLRAIGRHGDRPWTVGIRHPQGQGVLAALEVSGDESVFTSGNYERFREDQGVRYPHILDPRTGWPVAHVASVTVIHDNGAVADAAATALVVAGPQAWQRIARQLGIKAVMLVDEAGTVYMSPAMQARIRFTGNPPERMVVSEPM